MSIAPVTAKPLFLYFQVLSASTPPQSTEKKNSSSKSDEFVPVSFISSDEKIDFLSSIKVRGINTVIQSALADFKDQVFTEADRTNQVKDLEQAILKRVKPVLGDLSSAQEYGIRTLANFLHEAKTQGMESKDIDEMINELSHMSLGFKASDKVKVKDAYEQSELFLDIAYRFSKKTKNPEKLFASAFQNGLEAEGLSPQQARQTSEMLSKIILRLDDKARREVFKAAGIMMNYQDPLQFIIRNIQKDTSVENKAFNQFKEVMQFSDDTQKQVTKALLDVINEQEFDSKLDPKILEAIAVVQDPLSLVDNDTKEKQKQEILSAAQNSGLAKDSIKNLERLLANPELLIDGLSTGFQATKTNETQCQQPVHRKGPIRNFLHRIFGRR
ncbi:MAG: hypothetical protein RLZZ361_655 [Cyanobacteriota bacterium]|jgi:hypothetical protein